MLENYMQWTAVNKRKGLADMSWLKKQIEKRRWKAKLRQMDCVWRFRGGDGWQLFPPSYYYLYPLEELKKEEERILGELEAMIQNHQEKIKTSEK